MVSIAAVSAAGCASSKLSPGETEAQLRAQNPGRRDIRCVDGTGGWDYDCSYRFTMHRRPQTVTIGVNVNDTRITEQAAP